MITQLEEEILNAYYEFVDALKEKNSNKADKIYEKIKSLLKEEPHDSDLFIPFIEMRNDIIEYGDNYEAIASAYNALVYEFKKVKYPDKYKDIDSNN